MGVTIDEATKKWVIDGVIQDVSAVGQSGATPTIDLTTGHWFISGNAPGSKRSERMVRMEKVPTNWLLITVIHLAWIPG